MTSKTYVIAWDGALDNCLDIYSQLKDSDIDFVFHNVSSIDIEDSRWNRPGDIRYYGHFINSLEDFITNTDKEVFIFNAGDAGYGDYVTYTKKIESFFESDSRAGILAPSFDNDVFTNEASRIEDSIKHPGYYLSSMPNGIYVALRRNIAEILLNFCRWAIKSELIRIPQMVSGWGLDYVYTAISVYTNHTVYRDFVTFHHPASTGYSQVSGSAEFFALIFGFKNYCSTIGFDPSEVQRIYDMIEAKLIGRGGCRLTAEQFYIRMGGKESLDF
jgi:hypothetical protein